MFIDGLHTKSKVILVVLGLSLFSFGGLLFTFIKSSRMDAEHVEITEIIEIRDKIKILESLTTNNIAVKQAYLDFNKSFGEFEAELHNYIIRSNSKFKKELQILMIFSFLILLFCIYIIIKLINSIRLADSQIFEKTIVIEQKERHRIAMDLHDGMGSLLSSIGLYIKLLQVEKIDNKEVVKNLNQLRQLSDQAYNSFEEVINNLNPACLNKYGLVKSLENLCDKINNTGEVYFELQVENLQYHLSKSTEAILYRICNELINNTIKHSGAKSAKIDLSNIKNKISLRYTDNGIGFNPVIDYYHNGGKTGLKNLASRVESLGGTYKMESHPDQGVDIHIQFSIT